MAAFAPWLPAPPARVLDCACGLGLLAAGLARAGYDAHASDISPEMVARTRALGVAAEVRAWEVLTVWPLAADERMDDLRATGLERQHSTHSPEVPRHRVASTLR